MERATDIKSDPFFNASVIGGPAGCLGFDAMLIERR